jgi:hypothetical protein
MTARLGVNWYDATGAFMSSSIATVGTLTGTAPTILTRSVTAPAGAVKGIFTFGRLNAAGELKTGYVGSPMVRRMNGGELIVDGAITADKIAANAITAAKINANAVTTDKLAANSITTDKIAANQITAGLIATGAISADKMAANSITAANAALGNASVDTLQIKGQAVTVPVRAQVGGNFVVSDAVNWQTVISLVINRQGFATDLQFWCAVAGFGDVVARFAIFRGSTLLTQISQTIGHGGRAVTCSWNYIDWNTGTGNTTYSVRALRGGASQVPYNNNVQVGVRYLSAIQFKR